MCRKRKEQRSTKSIKAASQLLLLLQRAGANLLSRSGLGNSDAGARKHVPDIKAVSICNLLNEGVYLVLWGRKCSGLVHCPFNVALLNIEILKLLLETIHDLGDLIGVHR